MPAPIRRVDELGFPLPNSFDDLNQPNSRPKQTWGKFFYRYRWAVLLLILPLLFGGTVIDYVRQYVAQRMLHSAIMEYARDRLPEALASANRALFWEPDQFDRWQEFAVRAEIRYQMQDLNGSVEDLNETIQRLDDSAPRAKQLSDQLREAFGRRAWVCERLGRHRQAIADSTTALKMVQDDDDRAQLLNQRAYIRALANLELEPALEDVDQSLGIKSDAGVIDTRAYILFRLGKYDAALKAIDEAIRRWSGTMGGAFAFGADNGPRIFAQDDDADQPRDYRVYRETLAVMYHHRGEIRLKLGKETEGNDDIRKAVIYGYNPERGVY